MRDIFEVLEQIRNVLEEYNNYIEMKTVIENLKSKLRYKAPELRWNYVYEYFIVRFIPPKTDVDYKVLSIWTTKTIEELKEK